LIDLNISITEEKESLLITNLEQQEEIKRISGTVAYIVTYFCKIKLKVKKY